MILNVKIKQAKIMQLNKLTPSGFTRRPHWVLKMTEK